MTAPQQILRRIGLVLIILGIIDIGVMAYCIVHNQSYSSSFNIFAVIAGVLLMRGHLKTAELASKASAFFLGSFTSGALLFTPLLLPLSLLQAELKFHFASMLGSLISAALLFGVLIWVYRQLRSSVILEALRADGCNTNPPYWPASIGMLIPMILGVVIYFSIHGEPGHNALAKAQAQGGSGYQYVIRSLAVLDHRGSAVIAAYNDKEIREFEVHWEQ